jgi:hypothetical protein
MIPANAAEVPQALNIEIDKLHGLVLIDVRGRAHLVGISEWTLALAQAKSTDLSRLTGAPGPTAA